MSTTFVEICVHLVTDVKENLHEFLIGGLFCATKLKTIDFDEFLARIKRLVDFDEIQLPVKCLVDARRLNLSRKEFVLVLIKFQLIDNQSSSTSWVTTDNSSISTQD